MINHLKAGADISAPRADIASALNSVNSAVAYLLAENVEIRSVVLSGHKPVIRIECSDYCRQLITSGIADYAEFSNAPSVNFRQGRFYLADCRITWTESLH